MRSTLALLCEQLPLRYLSKPEKEHVGQQTDAQELTVMRLLWRRFLPVSAKWVVRLHDRRHVFQVYNMVKCAHMTDTHIWRENEPVIA
jgi:hypothetical protein